MTGERRVISTEWTVFAKFVMPPVALGSVIWVMTVVLRSATADMPLIAKVMLVGFTAGFFLLARRYADLKSVALLDDTLAVSNFRREIVVPLRDVVRIKQISSRGWRTPNVIVAIDLAHDTDFGKRITFLSRPTQAPLGIPHPIVDELRDAVTAAKRADLAEVLAHEHDR